MKKTSIIARLAALGAAASITFGIVSAAADYGLPATDGAPVLAQATTAEAP